MLLFKLAYRNITRNKRRSIITVLSVAVGLAALIFLWGFNDGTNNQMKENVIRLSTGHVQIHATGFEKTLAAEKTIPDKQAIVAKVKSWPIVKAVSERVKTEALIGTSENSRGIILVGIDPVLEPKVTEIAGFVDKGKFFESSTEREVLVGERLAEKLQLELGSKVVMMTQALDGTLSGFAYHVKGIFHTGSQALDEVTVFAPIGAAQELLGLESDVHELAIRLHDRKLVPTFISNFKSGVPADTYDVSAWNEIVPEVEQWASWAEAIIRTILVAVMVVIGVSIMNTVLMSVFERTKELGVMVAIGTSPSQIVKLVLLETLVLEMIGIVIGLAAIRVFHM